MKKYCVVVDITHKEWYEVEAKSKEEAKAKAEEAAGEGESATNFGDDFISDIRVIEEIK